MMRGKVETDEISLEAFISEGGKYSLAKRNPPGRLKRNGNMVRSPSF